MQGIHIFISFTFHFFYIPKNLFFFGGGGYIGITLTVCLSLRLSVCPYFLSAQLLQNKWTETNETLHSCRTEPENVHEGNNLGPKYFKGDN